jgi:hypothetical protein
MLRDVANSWMDGGAADCRCVSHQDCTPVHNAKGYLSGQPRRVLAKKGCLATWKPRGCNPVVNYASNIFEGDRKRIPCNFDVFLATLLPVCQYHGSKGHRGQRLRGTEDIVL